MTTKQKPFKELPHKCHIAECVKWANVYWPTHTFLLPLCSRHAAVVEKQSQR